MFSKLFSWKKQGERGNDMPAPENANWSFLGADLHSHFIPGIDDGAQTIEDSLTLLRAMKDMGYRTIVTTPHVMIDHYPNTTQIIQNGLVTVQNALKENNIDIELRAAAEYYIDENFVHLLETEPLLTIYQKELLVEFSMMYEPPNLLDIILKIQSSGYKPIIAHPERYLSYHRKDLAKYRTLKDRGCLFQLNMLSISGYYGGNVKAVAEDLLRGGMYDYCGSDMHHEKHAAALKKMAQGKEYHILASYPFLNQRICSKPA
jgi:tyrosine-protein phosphatase YwqE